MLNECFEEAVEFPDSRYANCSNSENVPDPTTTFLLVDIIMKLVYAIFGAFVGAVAGYIVGVFVGMCIECNTFFHAEPSNLCGLVALFWYGPITALIGLISGIFISLYRSKPASHLP